LKWFMTVQHEKDITRQQSMKTNVCFVLGVNVENYRYDLRNLLHTDTHVKPWIAETKTKRSNKESSKLQQKNGRKISSSHKIYI